MTSPLILLTRHYDRVTALVEGRVLVGGMRAQCEIVPSVPANFQRMMADDDVLAGEMSLGFHVAVASGDAHSRFIGIPVFLSRSFRHGNVFVRKDSPLEDFSQLKGKCVALEEYAMTMGVWVRGLFAEAGVLPEDIRWLTARSPVVVPAVEANLRSRLKLQRAHGQSIWSLLERGEVDAVIGRPPDYRDVENGAFRRLLRDHWGHQRAYFGRTRVFPPMHLLVVRRDAFERHPQIAVDLFDAFAEAKRLAIEDLSTNLNALTATLPMLEAHVDETRRLFGADWWPYGLAANKLALSAFTTLCWEQGIVAAPVEYERMFCANTLAL
jgi:4,5-dihydroxyphthalate decarboxylase